MNDVPLHVLTFNLGTNIMTNQVAGTEAPLVKLCQSSYNGGWKDSTISQCTYNASQLIAQYDLFGLQEVNPQYRAGLIQAINSSGTDYRFISGYNIITGYNYNITGEGYPLTAQDHKIADRGLQVVWFPKLSLLFINLHAPHHIDLIGEINKSLSTIRRPKNIKHVIMLGDFNDHQRVLLSISLMLFDMLLTIPFNTTFSTSPLTCCTDNDYSSPGDYILTSSSKSSYYGYPQGYIRGRPLMSDHDPVVLITSLQI